MIKGFSLDDSIKLICDGEILTKPVIPLNEEEKKLLIDNYFDQFHRDMKTRLYLSKCLEGIEIQEYYKNPLFLQGRAFIFMSRCLNRFDKNRYEGKDFGITPEGEEIPALNKIDYVFARDFHILNKDDSGHLFYKDLRLGKTYHAFKIRINKFPDIAIELKRNVQLARLKFFWVVFYRTSINQMAGETIKWRKNKGIPTKPDLKRAGIDPDEYIKKLKDLQNYQIDSRTISVFEEEDEKTKDYEKDLAERYRQLESELIGRLPYIFRRYFYCSNVLGMERVELALEFSDKFAKLVRIEYLVKKKLKRLIGVNNEY